MTFSVVARCADAFGVAVASRYLAVGAVVPAAEAGSGALATQSYANLAYRPQGLALLRTGGSAAQVVAGLTAADPGRAQRQLGVVAATGDGATFTGPACHEWAGGVCGDGYAIQGNLLTGPEVVAAMRERWLADAGEQRLAHRLVAALQAGDKAGGDRRGRQSAAVLVVSVRCDEDGTGGVLVDLRVDDHDSPVIELRRLLDIHDLYFGKPDPAALHDLTGDLAEEVRRRLTRLGHPPADATTAALDSALANWAAIENFEGRLVPGKIDHVVLNALRLRQQASPPA